MANKNQEALLQEQLQLLQEEEVLLLEQEQQADVKQFGFTGSVPKIEYLEGERNLAGNLIERPGAASRESIRSLFTGDLKKRFTAASINPGGVETFQEEFLRNYYDIVHDFSGNVNNDVLRNMINSAAEAQGVNVSAVGMSADVLTNPFDLTMILAGQLPGTRAVFTALAESKFGRYASKVANANIGRKVSNILKPAKKLLSPPVKRSSKVLKDVSAQKNAALKSYDKLAARSRASFDDQIRNANLTGQGDIDDIVRQRETTNIKFAQESPSQTSTTNIKLLDADDAINTQIHNITSELDDAVIGEANLVREKIPGFFKDTNKAYRQSLDDIADDMVKSGKSIVEEDAFSMYDNVLNKIADDPVLADSPAAKIITKLRDKYDTPGRPISLSHIVKERQAIWKRSSSGVKSGKTAFTSEDVVLGMFEEQFGEVAATHFPTFRPLQNSIKPALQAKKILYREFRPSQQFATEPGQKVIRSVAEGKGFKEVARKEADELFKLVEEGTDVGKVKIAGTGELRGKSTKLSKDVKSLQQKQAVIKRQRQIDDVIRKEAKGKTSAEFDAKLASTKAKLKAEIDSINAQKEAALGTLSSQKENRLIMLQERSASVGRILDDAKRLRTIRNILIGISLGGKTLKGFNLLGGQ